MFRKPIGEYPVGIRKYDTEKTGEGDRRRRVPLAFYYPAREWDLECPYMDIRYQKMSPDSADNGVHTFCGIGPAIADGTESFPVIIFNHGLSGFEMESTVLCADLASMGYLVVSIGHPYGASIVTYTDGSRFLNPEPFEQLRFKLDKVEPLWYEDIVAASDLLSYMKDNDPEWNGRMDLKGMGIMGVSFGGCVSVAAVLKNRDLSYAVNLDGSMFVKPEYIYKDKPVLVMCSPFNYKAHVPLVDNGCTRVIVEKIKKVSHFEFSDGVYLSDKGKNNREWADRISRSRVERILDFIKNSE